LISIFGFEGIKASCLYSSSLSFLILFFGTSFDFLFFSGGLWPPEDAGFFWPGNALVWYPCVQAVRWVGAVLLKILCASSRSSELVSLVSLESSLSAWLFGLKDGTALALDVSFAAST